MIPGPWYVPHGATSREGRAWRELRDYLRWEYNSADLGWLLAQIRGRREPFGKRLLAWIRRRKSDASERRTAVQSESRASGDPSEADRPGSASVLTETRGDSVSVDDCEHAALVALGSGGGTSYGQCSACGGVLVIREGRVWLIAA